MFDALQRKYLEVVLLEVFAVDAQKGKKKKKGTTKKELIECFSFKVSYDENGARLQQLSGGSANRQSETCRDQIKRNTAEVLHSLIDLTHSLRPLPPNRILSMKVSSPISPIELPLKYVGLIRL